MGQATVDLPDPLESPPPAAKTSTDDLLSQLAGDEIDRLLAEAELSPAGRSTNPSPVHISPPSEPEKEVVEPVPPATADEAPAEVAAAVPAPGPVAEPEPAPAPLSSVSEEAVTAELDALFSAVEKDRADSDAEAEAAARAILEGDQTSTAEREGLTTVAAMAPESAQAAPQVVEDGPLPLYLKPLEWLSAPLSIFPPAVRDLVGKAAIVTLINAVAIIAYILIVRGAH
jgi:hypothetical protein